MITPTSGSIVIPPVDSQVADGIWVSSININAPSPTQPVVARIRAIPFNSTSSVMFPSLSKNIFLPDVFAEAAQQPAVAEAMGAIFNAIQVLIVSQSLF